MSTSLSWSPVETKSLCSGCGRVAEALEKAFGRLPLTLNYDSLDKLNGMAATWTGDDNPYEALGNAIVEFGTIQVRAGY